MTDEASIVNHDNRPKTNKIARAMYIRLLLAAGLSDRPSSPIVIHRLKSTTKNGAQGRIRTSVAHNAADLQSAAINHSATCAFLCAGPQPVHAHTEAARTSSAGGHLQLAGGHCKAGTARSYNQTSKPFAMRGKNWSWRRDLNPRPPDYKSGALPAELRQPTPRRNAHPLARADRDNFITADGRGQRPLLPRQRVS